MGRKVILFELNEVPWRVLEDFARERPRSVLARLLASAETLETQAEDTTLSPWITWPTVHRGVGDEQHTISDFNQDLGEINRAYPPLWELAHRADVPTGVFGSLHSYPPPEDAADYRFYVPDVFAAGSECFPKQLEPFQDFNLVMSRGSARNVSAGIPWGKALRFLARAPALGLRPATALDVGRQLVDERRRRWVKVRRRTYQVLLAFDLFMKQLRRTRPAFCTFFTNHVASSMHRYWAARYPEDYEQFEFSDEWVATYGEEIGWTLGKCEAMLRRLTRFVERQRDYTLWVASSMGQAATEANVVHTQVFLTDVGRLMDYFGLQRDCWETRPAMLPRVIVRVAESHAGRFAAALDSVTVSQHGPLPWKLLSPGVFRIHPGVIQNVSDETCGVGAKRVPFAALGFSNEPIEDATGSNAYHVPGGSLLIYDPRHAAAARGRGSISTRAIAPRLLAELGVTLPSHLARSRAA